MLLQNIRWNQDADVVVVGYGSAGAVAAISAAQASARVLVIEKQDSPVPVSSSLMSSAVVLCPTDVAAAKRYMETLYKVDEGLYWTGPDILDAWARYCAEKLESMGAVLELRRSTGEYRVPGYESISSFIIPGHGPAMMDMLYAQSKKRGVQVMTGLSGTRLITDSKGEVIGIQAKRREGAEVNIQARRAVILATGGFEFDEQMKLQYLPIYPTHFWSSPPAGTGDGIRMALGVGAQLWHMNCAAAAFALKFPEVPLSMSFDFDGHFSPDKTTPSVLPSTKSELTYGGYITVDRSGKRYLNENYEARHAMYYELAGFDTITRSRPRVPSYWIFDHRRMNAGPLVGGSTPRLGKTPGMKEVGVYDWSPDNRPELERGWIEQADTIKELGRKLGMDNLAETVRHYNLCCKHGKDVEYGRKPGSLLPLSTAPYYAVKLWPGGPNTQGGPRRNAKAQVINMDGVPVPRLYSAGELGSMYGMLYPAGGGNLAECIAFGRVAGANAAEQSPR